MGFSSIPNQPILFEDPIFAGQSCLNNDTRAYAQLLQAGDTMCIQLANSSETAIYNFTDLTINGNILPNGNFSNNLSQWHQGEGGVDDGPWPWSPFYWYLNNGGAQKTSGFGVNGPGIFQTLPSGTIGDLFLISLDFETYNNIGALEISLGDFAGSSFNTVIRNGNAPLNFDGRYTVILSSYAGLDLFFNGTTVGSKPLLKDIRVFNCTGIVPFIVDANFLAGWMYVESCNGYQVMAANYDLTSFFTINAGQNYKFTFNIRNLQQGSIDIFDYDGNLIVSATENRDYEVFFSYAGNNGPLTFSVNNNLSVGAIISNFQISEECFNHRLKLVSNTQESAWFDFYSSTFPIRYKDGRIFWCFDMSQINDITSGNPLLSECYNVRIDDCGNGEYDSYTTINYTTGTHECSVWMEGDCQGKAFDFFFNDPSTPITFKLGQRLRLLQFNPMYPIKGEEYLYSNGDMKRTFAQTSKKREAWFDYVDEPTHDVIRLQLLCDTLSIDGKYYYFSSADYQPEWSQNGKYNLAQSRVELMAVEEKTLFNKNCI